MVERVSERGVGIQRSWVLENMLLCRDHFKLVIQVEGFLEPVAGQFVHLSPSDVAYECRAIDWDCASHIEMTDRAPAVPLLRRAFSIAGYWTSAETGKATLDVIYRVVGKATRWLESLSAGDTISCLGPLGNAFPISDDKQQAWLVAGGVGLPPLLWLAEELGRRGKSVTAFCGAQSRALFPLTLVSHALPDDSAREARPTVAEFAQHGVSVVLSTDDGTLGFCGRITEALLRYHEAHPISPESVVVYTCGPEAMMRAVARFCMERAIECHVCMERNMACGMGTCQSCVVPVHDTLDAEGWSYQLCCTDGPIFRGEDILWRR